MTEPEIFDTLTTIFRTALSDDSIVLKPETAPKDIPRWDSFRYVDIILRVEEVLDIKIRSREANKLRNVGEMVALIQSKQVGS
jgi:acyl carrier protein